ncbi:MAG TPA: MmcQ/YjbR family DNA-binding protein [Candidatus Elarobacter sp.]|jgi:predicted DNA-binding protein (MmcQ/YjbR family)|nr:MmcQ/YjbR family DNA-binding protein [Candidatus Elarobacter sp.]
MSKKKVDPSAKVLAHALTFPGAWKDDPWGDSVVKVGKKIFAFVGEETVTLKLTEAHEAAMSVPGAKPTAYGLGKAGWVTLPLLAGVPPFEVLCDWIEESYRAVAPKKLAAQITTG